jgi:hypothetical protein
MKSKQCNADVGYQLNIFSKTDENHRALWSSWPIAGPSGLTLTSSQQAVRRSSDMNCTQRSNTFRDVYFGMTIRKYNDIYLV